MFQGARERKEKRERGWQNNVTFGDTSTFVYTCAPIAGATGAQP